jgi:hypothetical protein
VIRRSFVAAALATQVLILLRATADAGAVVPNPLTFGTVSVGTSKTLTATVTLKNPNSFTTESYAGVAITGSSRFTVGANTCGATTTCTIDVVFAPTAAQSESGTLTVTLDDRNTRTQSDTFPTVNIALTGTGVGSPPPQLGESGWAIGLPIVAVMLLVVTGFTIARRHRVRTL